MGILITDCRLMDPANGVDRTTSVLLESGRVARIGNDINSGGHNVINARGKWCIPGLIDLHVHLREPGFEYKETIETGARSAAAGGFTSVCAMPNTQPVIDTPDLVGWVLKRPAVVNVLPMGSLTQGQNGLAAADISGMSRAGAVAFSEDGKSVAQAKLMKDILAAAAECKRPVFSHCEDISLVDGGVINHGAASRFGLPGISNDSEEAIVARDILLAASVGARLHICHISTAGTVRLLREAKARGENVTGEATPHHFSLNDGDIETNDGRYKMNPPLRSKSDMKALHQGLADGTIDVIATDHAPHSEQEKSPGFESAANGIVGLETALALGITYLVEGGILTEYELVAKMTCNPARILGIDRGNLAEGKAADIVIVDPQKQWRVEPELFYSRGRSTPFAGKCLRGAVMYTIVGGKLIYSQEKGFEND